MIQAVFFTPISIMCVLTYVLSLLALEILRLLLRYQLLQEYYQLQMSLDSLVRRLDHHLVFQLLCCQVCDFKT